MYVPSCISLHCTTCIHLSDLKKDIETGTRPWRKETTEKQQTCKDDSQEREKNGKEDNDSKDGMGCTKNDVHTTYLTM